MKNLMKNTIFLYREWIYIKSTNAPAILMIKKACNKRKEHSSFAAEKADLLERLCY
ncbi:hypothetical protein OH784_24305 [Ectobacillus funiculus]|uniref:hypothetical protein n=1 Tax=Ectobacillus funiculus TaxID=137993 RepID=UPI00397D984F